MAETAGAVPATMPGPIRGRAPGKSETLYNRFGLSQQRGSRFLDFRTAADSGHGYLAATELTVMVSPSNVPVTVAFLPACLSSVARAVLSEVSRI